MTKALIKRGFREIVFLSEQHDAWTRGAARRQGFSEAMREAGRNSHAHIRLGKPPLSIEDGSAAAKEILQKFPQVDCIFCVSDMAAFGVQSRLLQMGIKIPEMIVSLGLVILKFHNFPRRPSASHCRPPQNRKRRRVYLTKIYQIMRFILPKHSISLPQLGQNFVKARVN